MKIFRIKNLSVIFLSFVLSFVSVISVYSINNGETALADSDKEYSVVDDSLDFCCDRIIVVLDSEISEINKVHTKQFFKGVAIDSITDLTKRNKNFKKNENFKQILRLDLTDGTKEKVIKAINVLRKIPGIYSAEPDYIVEPASVTPDDSYFVNGSQWNLNGTGGINVPDAWNITKGSKSVRVGIIDTGIASHPDLNSNVVAGYDYENNNSITYDDGEGHGTAVAGIIGAQTGNTIGVAGINWNIQLVPVQCSYYDITEKRYMFHTSVVAEAIEKITELWWTEDRISILNHGIAGFGSSHNVLAAIQNYPGLFVWSAGNNGQNVDNFANIDSYNIDNLISVGAIDKYNERSVWSATRSSNFGKVVNIFAPGGKGRTDSENIPTTDNNNSYCYFDGTSAAAPHVTGVAALMLAKVPHLSASQIKSLILDNSDTITITVPTDSGGTTTQQVKKLNAYKAVSAAQYVHSNYYRYKSKDEHEVKCKECDIILCYEQHNFVPYSSKARAIINVKWVCSDCGYILHNGGIGEIPINKKDAELKAI